MRLLLLLAALAVPSLAHADAKAEFEEAKAQLEDGKGKVARDLFTRVVQGSASPALKAQAALYLGCMAIEDQEGPSGKELGRQYFLRGLSMDPAAKPIAGWHPTCTPEFAAVKARVAADRASRAKLEADVQAREKKVRDTEEALQKERALREEKERQLEKERADAIARGRRPPPVVEQPKVPEGPSATEKELAESRKELAALQSQLNRMSDESAEREKRFLAALTALEVQRSKEPPPPPPEKKADFTLPIAILGGLAVAGTGTGAVFGLKARSAHASFDGTTYQTQALDLAATGQRSQRVANVAFGTAVICAVTAGVLFVLQPRPEVKSEEPTP